MNATTRTAGSAFHGTDRLLYGMILGVVTFWLFAQTTLNIAQRSRTSWPCARQQSWRWGSTG